MSGLGDIDEASYTGISAGVRASGTGGEPTDGCAGEDSIACSGLVSYTIRSYSRAARAGCAGLCTSTASWAESLASETQVLSGNSIMSCISMVRGMNVRSDVV